MGKIPNSGKTGQPVGSLDAVSRAMPALSEAGKIGAKAAKVGFDWPDAGGVVEKLREETAELEVEMARRTRKPLEKRLAICCLRQRTSRGT